MNRLDAHEVVLVIGKRGSGKSYRAKELLARELKAGARVACFDPHDEYSRLGRPSKQTNLGPLTQRVTVDQLLENPGVLDRPDLACAFVPRSKQRKAIAADFSEFQRLVINTGNLTVCADEVGEYDDVCRDDLETLATQSRHFEMPVIFVAQRATQVPRGARSQASSILCGKQDEEDDVKALAKRCGKDFAERVSRLPRRTLIEWRDDTPTPKETTP